MLNNWIDVKEQGLPNFLEYGFHTGKLIDVRYADGTEEATLRRNNRLRAFAESGLSVGLCGMTDTENRMKLEIEITEDEIRSAVERKVRTAVADQTNQWNVDSYIKDRVKEHWKLAVDALVAEALNDSAKLREKIAAELEKKLRAQLSAALRNAA